MMQGPVLVGTAVIVAPFGFFEMQVKGMFWQAFELCQSNFRQAPEAFDAVDMNAATGEFIVGMIDAIMPIAQVD